MTTTTENTIEEVPVTDTAIPIVPTTIPVSAPEYSVQSMRQRAIEAERAALNPRPPKAPWTPDPPRPARIPGPVLKAAKSKVVPRVEKLIAAKREPVEARKLAGQVIEARREALHAKIAAFTAQPNLDDIDDFLALHVQAAAAETASHAFAKIIPDQEHRAALNASSAELAPLLQELAGEAEAYLTACRAKGRELKIAEASLYQPDKKFSASLRDFEKAVGLLERSVNDAVVHVKEWVARGGVPRENFTLLYSKLRAHEHEIELPLELPLPGKQS